MSTDLELGLKPMTNSTKDGQAAKLQCRLAILRTRYEQGKKPDWQLRDEYNLDDLVAGQNHRSKGLNAVIARSFEEFTTQILLHEAAGTYMRAILLLRPSRHHIATLYRPSTAGSGPALFLFETLSPTHIDDSREPLIRLCIDMATEFPNIPVYLHFMDIQRGLGCLVHSLSLINKLLAYQTYLTKCQLIPLPAF